jgi:hypothetical protein
MTEVIDILEKEVAELAEDLKSSETAKKQKATGEWIDSVEVVRDVTSVSIWANDYTEWLIQGRAGGSMPPVDPLITWVQAKLGVSGKEGESIAWAVAKKIEREGTDYYPQGTDLLDGVLTEQRFNDILEKVGQDISLFIGQNLIRQFEEAFA